MKKLCINCPSSKNREAKYPGPRCYTCHKAKLKERRANAWEKRLVETYNITPEQYWALYEHQGGKCYICRRANGRTKKLSVDHDHSCCSGSKSCGLCIRGLLCSRDNAHLGHLRDDPEAFIRAADYLRHPPARIILRL